MWSIINYGASIWGTRSYPEIDRYIIEHVAASRVSVSVPLPHMYGKSGYGPGAVYMPTVPGGKKIVRQNHTNVIRRTRGWSGRVYKMLKSINKIVNNEPQNNITSLH